MNTLVPSRFLFRFSIPVNRVDGIPFSSTKKTTTGILSLPPACTLPEFSGFEQKHPFGEIRMAWNPEGLAFEVRVTGKKTAVNSNPEQPWDSDSFHLWIDTRNTQTIHRASRFCHHFVGIPSAAGKKASSGMLKQLAIPRAREETALADPQILLSHSESSKNGYLMRLWLPREALQGFDPDSYNRLGFYYYLRDRELGEQFLSVNQEFPFATDPSLWWTLELNH